ncbi:metallopeptidase M24 family protein [Striga asiatica]|uniref:Metallopeptidase M24 family protein n=1 Tax=Striga asiatica TaxID=4170 RepID=A0A5A7QX27_STRAF|nr:metallopeptidase M24 family protein [Striga asiatica]
MKTHGETELDWAKGNNENAKIDGDGLTQELGRGVHDAGLAGAQARHAVPASGVQKGLAQPIVGGVRTHSPRQKKSRDNRWDNGGKRKRERRRVRSKILKAFITAREKNTAREISSSLARHSSQLGKKELNLYISFTICRKIMWTIRSKPTYFASISWLQVFCPVVRGLNSCSSFNSLTLKNSIFDMNHETSMHKSIITSLLSSSSDLGN